jgi:hypothetical protein
MKNLGNVLIAVLISVALLLASISFWYHQEILDRTNFTMTFSSGLLSESAKQAIASEIVDKGLSNRPLLKVAVGTTGKSAIYTILSSNAFQSEFNTFVGNIHVRMTSPNDPTIGINIVPLKEYVLPLVGLVRPDLTKNLNITELPDRVVLIPDKYIPKLYQFTPIITWIGIISALVVIIGAFYLFHRIQNKSYALRLLGIAITFGALISIGILKFAPNMMLSQIADVNAQVILKEVVSAFITSYLKQLYVLLAIGITLLFLSFVVKHFTPQRITKTKKRKKK